MMQIFPAATRAETPWKNGGGITRLVASTPGIGKEFGWRLSLADVSSAGTFSCFPGISRLMGILQGQLRLEVAGLAPKTLTPGGPAFAFAGDIPTVGTPLNGTVQDINLMFDPDLFAATLNYTANGAAFQASKAALLVLALTPLTLNGVALTTLDAALLPSGTALETPSGRAWIAALQPCD